MTFNGTIEEQELRVLVVLKTKQKALTLFWRWLEISLWLSMENPRGVEVCWNISPDESQREKHLLMQRPLHQRKVAVRRYADNFENNTDGWSQDMWSPCQAWAQLEQPWERKMPYRGEAGGQRGVKWVTNWCWGITSGRLVFSSSEDVSCERLSPWKPGCCRGPAGNKGHRQGFAEAVGGCPRQHSREDSVSTESPACKTGGCRAPGRGRAPRRRPKLRRSTSLRASEHASAGRGGTEHWSRLSPKQLCRSLGSRTRGRRHHVLKRVQAPERGRHKVHPGPAGQVLQRATRYMIVQLAQVSSAGPLRWKAHPTPDPGKVLLTCQPARGQTREILPLSSKGFLSSGPDGFFPNRGWPPTVGSHNQLNGSKSALFFTHTQTRIKGNVLVELLIQTCAFATTMSWC